MSNRNSTNTIDYGLDYGQLEWGLLHVWGRKRLDAYYAYCFEYWCQVSERQNKPCNGALFVKFMQESRQEDILYLCNLTKQLQKKSRTPYQLLHKRFEFNFDYSEIPNFVDNYMKKHI